MIISLILLFISAMEMPLDRGNKAWAVWSLVTAALLVLTFTGAFKAL